MPGRVQQRGEYQKVSGSKSLRYPGYAVSAASSSVDLWVPGDGFLWVCPTSVTHYIDAHGFCPPPQFCEAVLRCPPMKSLVYLKAVLNNGGRELGFGGTVSRTGYDVPLPDAQYPVWRNKDKGAWTVPKGEIRQGEESFETAKP